MNNVRSYYAQVLDKLDTVLHGRHALRVVPSDEATLRDLVSPNRTIRLSAEQSEALAAQQPAEQRKTAHA